MAKMEDGFSFTGSLGPVSAYRMRGHDKIIIRTRGGASREKIRKSAAFVNTRRNNSEFGGRATASRWIMGVLMELKPLADHNIAGPLNALIKPVHLLDTTSDWGQRNIAFSLQPEILHGFNLNKTGKLDEIVRSASLTELNKGAVSASVKLPALINGLSFFPRGNHPYFGFVVSLGIVPDLKWTARGYKANEGYPDPIEKTSYSTWYPVAGGCPTSTVDLQLPITPPDSEFILVLGLGLRWGRVNASGAVEQVKYQGAAKIIAVA